MRKGWLMLAGFVALLGIIGLNACQPGGSVSGDLSGINIGGQQQGIVVNGQEKVTAAPDIASIRLGIQSQAPTVGEAQSKASVAMDKVMNSLTGNGVAKKDIQTQVFNISQQTRYDDKTGQQVVLGYQVTNTVTAKIRDVAKAGSIIDAVSAAGGDLTRVDSINFSIEDPTVYENSAREKAMADAKAKAKQLADLAGVTLGKATYISENSYVPVLPSPVSFGIKSAVAAPETAISPGETEITSNVQITYAIK